MMMCREEEMEEERRKAENMTTIRDKSINTFYAGKAIYVQYAMEITFFYFIYMLFQNINKQ